MKLLETSLNRNALFDRKVITWISLILMAVYIAGIHLLKLIYQCSFNDVILFNPEITNGSGLAEVFIGSFVFFSGVPLLFLLPGWIFLLHFEGLRKDMPLFVGLAFVVTLALFIVSTTAFKMITLLSLNRTRFLVILVSIISVGLAVLWRRFRKGQRPMAPSVFLVREMIPPIILTLIMIAFIAMFHQRVIGERLVKHDYRPEMVLSIPLGEQPDDLEIFGLTESLKRFVLPYWDLEYADRFGFVFTDPPLFPFISMFSQQLFGENRIGFVLPVMTAVVMIFLLIVMSGSAGRMWKLLICSLMLVNFLYYSLGDDIAFVHKGYLLIFFIIVSYEYLLRRNYGMFLLFAAVTTVTKFYGVFFIALGLVGVCLFFKERRYEIFLVALKYCFVIAGVVVFVGAVGVVTGNAQVYFRTIVVEHLLRFDYLNILSAMFPSAVVFDPPFEIKNNLQFLVWALYGTAFLFPVVFLFGKDKRENFYSLIAIAYFLVIFFGRYHLMRYVIPLVPLTAIIVCSKVGRWITLS